MKINTMDAAKLSDLIIALSSPFHYSAKDYKRLRGYLQHYSGLLGKLLETQHQKSTDQMTWLCIQMHGLLESVIHAFRKKKMKKVREFCAYQSYLLSRYQWPMLEMTKTLLFRVMPQEEDYGCPICLSLLHEPMLFHPCQHRFCGKCTDALFVSAGVSSQFSVSSDGLSLPCPVCRTAVEKSHVVPDQALANWLALYFPLCTPWWKKLYKKCKKMLVFLLNLCCVSPMYFPDVPYDTDDHIHAHAYFIVM